MKKLIGATALVSLAALLSPAPAMAEDDGEVTTRETCLPGTSLCQGGVVRHYSPDDGYDPPIIVFCNYGDGFPTLNWAREKYVEEGTSSKSDCGDDTDGIYIRSGEELWCRVTGQVYWTKEFDAVGSHKINDLWEQGCTLRKD